MTPRLRSPQLLAVAGALGAFGLLGPAVAGAQSVAGTPPSMARIGHAPALPSGAQVGGTVANSTSVSATVALAPSDPAGLAAYATGVSTPGSPIYHHFLSVAQFAEAFGPTADQVATVRQALSDAGLNPGALSANGLSIPVTATAGAVSTAFSVSLRSVTLPDGRTAYANTQAPELPVAAAALVEGVIGLDTVSRAVPQGIFHDGSSGGVASHAAHTTVPGAPVPCAGASGTHEYTADQFASTYNLNGLYTAGDFGAGQKIAIYELEPNSTADIAAYQQCYGTNASVSYVAVDGGSGTGPGQGEAALDIEDVIGLAPQASVIVYQGPNNSSGPYDLFQKIISQNQAKVISTSWGLCEPQLGSSDANAESTLFQEAATQGQSMFSASGDDGSDDCGNSTISVDDPGSQPWVTSVGGTTLSTLGPPPSETAWNSGFSGGIQEGGGGGISQFWAMPTYQSGAPSALNVINPASSGAPCSAPSGHFCREVPDVSAAADPSTGYAVFWNGAWHGIGGTSAAAPTWAAVMALANASSGCAGVPVGFANPALYAAAGSAYAADFHDVLVGNNGAFSAGTGFDMATGLGSPNAAALAATLCHVSGGTTGPTGPTGTTGTTGTTGSTGTSGTTGTTGPKGPTGTSGTSGTTGTGGTGTSGSTGTSGASGTSGGSGTSSTVSVTVSNPGSQVTTAGSAVSLQVHGSASDSSTLSYSATGLPTGLSINGASGVISGTPTTAGSFPVTIVASSPSGITGSTAFTWVVSSAVPPCTPSQLLGNAGFETGSASPWSASSGVIVRGRRRAPARSGNYDAMLDGYRKAHTDTLTQTVTLPANCHTDNLSFYLRIRTSQGGRRVSSRMKVQVLSSSGAVLSTLDTFTNRDAGGGYALQSYSLAAFAGQRVTVRFTGRQSTRTPTTFQLDDTSLSVAT